MPLTQLGKMFEEIAHTTPEVISNDPGWLFVQRCESRWAVGGYDDTPVTALLVYKSVMVRDSWDMYAPVRDMLMGARKMDVLAHGYLDDDQMMRRKGEYLVARLTHEESFPDGPFTLPQLQVIINSAIGTALGAAGVVVPA
ncbi:hypothetical protein PBI_TOAKA_76 [Mycobacterium phage Toaka]|nr:hypothetical protein PBI_TOAKA_76 [Mycobacterium phage Toaka]